MSDSQQGVIMQWAEKDPFDPRWMISATVVLFGFTILLGLDFIYGLLNEYGVVDS